ncbi:MAG: flagellar basal body rod protein FlgC [Phycisphaeraceae bacterium]|nr:flagellar basal body rod protein FlgC [Phycisphaeraceae bacterium]
MFGALDISTSGMIAQRTRLETLAANIASKDVLEDANGNYAPYQRRIAVFAPGDPSASSPSGRALGVHVSEIALSDDLRRRYDPTSKWADAEGYVMTPNIDPVIEQINMIEASRAYEANVAAAEATKAMTAQALRLIA